MSKKSSAGRRTGLFIGGVLFGLIRGVYVPDENGEYTHYDEFDDSITDFGLLAKSENRGYDCGYIVG